MEKNIGFAGGSTQPTAPPPTAPPSYEEAVIHASMPQPMVPPPYPIEPTNMPQPVNYNLRSNQPTMPIRSNYPGPPGPMSQQPHAANPNFVPQPAVRNVHQPLTFVLSPNPVKMTCSTCHANMKTTTISDHQPSAHICCIVLCLLGCCLCSCLPYCMSTFMSVHHFCPNCKNYIGTWKG